ncbi:hypothetical protein XA68_10813 [Ophiocordyceps unilateralis]|uniref:40S ribosomal protein S8 n=1 Tax=Ophiocordyceps unilateralis TaxID=268505 RepID=A0A2A9PI22_OPHUN|nr:hypothetical protein XA68_10813 [Ophiocordyceps unilateralis]
MRSHMSLPMVVSQSVARSEPSVDSSLSDLPPPLYTLHHTLHRARRGESASLAASITPPYSIVLVIVDFIRSRTSGAKRAFYRKKRAFEAGRQGANTRIGPKRIHTVRTRGGNHKYRALRLDSGNFAWASEGCTRKTRVIAVAYHPSNNELVRTNTLTRSAVVQVDAAPFRQWYEAHYGQNLGRRRQKAQAAKEGKVEEEVKKSKSVEKKQAARFAASGKVEAPLEKQFEAGRLYAIISSRPGQSGRCDGYILEGDELAFYQRKLHK